MPGREGDIAHFRSDGQIGDGIGIELLRSEGRGEFGILLRRALLLFFPFLLARDLGFQRILRIHAAQAGQCIMHKQSPLRIAVPLHRCGAGVHGIKRFMPFEIARHRRCFDNRCLHFDGIGSLRRAELSRNCEQNNGKDGRARASMDSLLLFHGVVVATHFAAIIQNHKCGIQPLTGINILTASSEVRSDCPRYRE